MTDLQKVAEKGQSPIGSQRSPQDDRLARLEAKVDQLMAILTTFETTLKALTAQNKYPKP